MDKDLDTTTRSCALVSPTSCNDEWLETDGWGGYAMGTAAMVRDRRYHGLLMAAVDPPAVRHLLVAGIEVWLEVDGRRHRLSAQRYQPGVTEAADVPHVQFRAAPWPTWEYHLGTEARVTQEIFIPAGSRATVVRFALVEGPARATLHVRPLLAGRDAHDLLRLPPDATVEQAGDGVVGIRCGGHLVTIRGGTWRDEPLVYRDFRYEEEAARGFDCTESLASPGVLRFEFDVAEREAVIVFESGAPSVRGDIRDWVRLQRRAERARRATFESDLRRAGDQYVVQRGGGLSIVAGYPWFADWGRDTFIAMRGLLIATRRYRDATRCLVEWSHELSRGMFPNRFPDRAGDVDEREYNSADAPLWFVVAASELLAASDRDGVPVAPGDRRLLEGAILGVVGAYHGRTRYGIRVDARDGLLAAGAPRQQLTWMDARVDGREVTPRSGKPVELNALWINALAAAASLDSQWSDELRSSRRSFTSRFWNESDRCLHDVIDVDHRDNAVDSTMRPNQILAIGGLPMAVVEGARAAHVVESVERHLLTPLGLRSLAPNAAGYVGRYEGGPSVRDGAYHQGTVWPWLLGPFVEAWVRVRGDGPAVRRAARERFLEPILAHLRVAGLGHVSEIADGDAPHTPRGCPFQAWSLGELIRLDESVLRVRSDDPEASAR